MAQLLVEVLEVTNLAAGATVVVPHNLESNGVAVAPTLVLANSTTPLVVQSVSTTGITVFNPSPLAQSSSFRLERGWQPEVDAFTVTPMLYNGSSGSSGQTLKLAAQTDPVLSFGANTSGAFVYPLVVSVPRNYLRAGSTIQVRVSGRTFNATGASLVTSLLWALDPDGAAPVTGIFANSFIDAVGPIVNNTQFCLTANATIRAAGGAVGALGGVSGSFGSGGAAINIGTTFSSAPNLDTTVVSNIIMSVNFSVAAAGNYLDIYNYEVYVTR